MASSLVISLLVITSSIGKPLNMPFRAIIATGPDCDFASCDAFFVCVAASSKLSLNIIDGTFIESNISIITLPRKSND